MTKSVLVFILSLFLLSSLNVYGAKKPANYEKMAQRLERIEKAKYPDESIVSRYLLTPKPRVLLPATGDTVGYTYYDYQANRRQIANGTDGIIHFTWMNLVGPDMSYNRYIDYNAWNFQDWLAPGGIHVTPDSGRGGYTGLDLLPDDREILGYHRNYPITPAGAFWGTTLSIDIYPGSGDFNSFDIPDSCDHSANKGEWPTVACSKMTNGDTAYIHITHAQGLTSGVDKDLGYVRCFEKPDNWDTLVCMSPGWGSPLLIPKDTKLEPNKVPYRFTICRLGGTAIATSPVSQKIAVVWLQNTGTSYTQNELMLLASTNNGNNWMAAGNMGTPVQLTNYGASGYIDRAYDDIAAVYDYNDNLHIIWTTYKSDYSNDVTLWHWSSVLPGIREITSLYDRPEVDPGAWNLLIAKPTIGVEYMPGDSAYNYLYIVYTRFWYGDISAGGYANGDLRLMASSNGGLTWRGPQESLASLNLTNTNSNGCTPGNCESEHWASIAERVDSFLYIQYIYDRDAGGIPLDEGTFTDNPVRYLKYPRPLIPIIPKMGYPYIFMTSALNNNTNTDSIVISNDGSATLYVQLSGPSWITSISPSNFSITEAGPPQIVHLTCNGAGLQDTILIDSLKIVSNNDYVGGGPNYVDTIWTRIHFVVSNSFTQTKHEIINTGAGGIVMNVSNVGTIDPELDSSQLNYNGHNYLWNWSPVILTNIPGYGWRGASCWTQKDFLPLSPLQITKNGCSSDTVIAVTSTYAPVNTILSPPYHWYWWWYAIEENSLFFTHPDSLRKVIVKYLTLHKNPPPPWWCNITPEPPTLPTAYFGFSADFDVPQDNYGYATNVGGFNPDSNLIWIKGTGIYDNYYAGILFLYTAKDGDTTWTPYSAHVLSGNTQVSPFGGDYNGDSLYKYMSLTPGWSVEPTSPQDIIILISALQLNNPDTNTVVTVKYALIVTDQGLTDLYSIASMLKQKRCGYTRHDTLWVEAHSPVDIIVTDPIGRSIGIDFNNIPDATYDSTNDQDKVTIPDPLIGQYSVKVKSEPGADTGHYSITVKLDGNEDKPLALNSPIPPPDQVNTFTYPVIEYLRGDANMDKKTSVSDVVFLINYLFKGGPAPNPVYLGDVNCDGKTTVSDVVYLINYLFKNGPAPCS
jgi:hypothetical protein